MKPALLLLGGYYEKDELFARVSPVDYDRCAELKWRADIRSHTTYAKANVIALRPSGERYRTIVYLHRFIAQPPEKFETHHRDFDGLNCVRGNLENVMHAYNQSNRRPYGEVGMYGVSRHRNKFQACITWRGRSLHIGNFQTEMEAGLAYDAKARELYGPFVRCNFPLEAEDNE